MVHNSALNCSGSIASIENEVHVLSKTQALHFVPSPKKMNGRNSKLIAHMLDVNRTTKSMKRSHKARSKTRPLPQRYH